MVLDEVQREPGVMLALERRLHRRPGDLELTGYARGRHDHLAAQRACRATASTPMR
jgi:hypothetical protein